MNTALIRVSLAVIAQHFFDDRVRVRAAILDRDDAAQGTITLLLEGDELPPEPPHGRLYARVTAEITLHQDEEHLVPRETRSVRFVEV